MRDWGERVHKRGYDSGGGGERAAGNQRTPDEESTERVFRVRQEIESAATRVEQLISIVRRDEWRTERGNLQQTHDTLLEKLNARELDAKASARAHEHYTNATEKLGDIATKLTNAQEPRRPVPPVAGEEAIESSIAARSAAPEDVLAWVSGLDARDRRAIVSRLDAVTGGSVNRTDGFALGLANYFGDLTVRSTCPDLRSKFLKTAENPRHFSRAAHVRPRARANATPDAGAGTNETNRTAIKAPVARPTASANAQESRGTTTGTQATGTPTHVQLAPAQGQPPRATAAPTAHEAAATSPRSKSDGNPLEPLNAERYWAKYGHQTMQRALDRAMAELVFEISGPGLTFPTSECGAFIMSSLGWRMQGTTPHHVSQLLDTSIYELIDGVRALDDRDRAADAFEPAVMSRIVERLGLGIRRAVGRLALPYAKARSRAVSAANAAAGDPIRRGLGPLQVPQGDPGQVQPDPNTLGARTTIEHAVAESMCAGFVEFHADKFPLIYDTTIPGDPRPVKLELERGRGDWLAVRVVAPASASAADVANALYGTPDLAHLVVGAGGRFSYVFPPGKQLAEPYETEFRNHMIDDGASPLDELRARNARDPVRGLDDVQADQRALTSAKASGAMATGAGAAPTLQRFEILQSVIDSIASAAVPLGVAPIIAPTQARVRQRRIACTADPAEATKWAAHASEQLTLVSDAKAGFDAITEQMLAMGLPAVSTADGSELVGDVTASMQGPTHELAAAFAGAVAASEQIDIGRERLAIAKERLAAYPFDMADRMLAVIRKRIASTSHVATMPMKSYETNRMAGLEAELSRTIGELRIAVVNGDGTAALKLTTLRSQLSMLDLQSTIGSTLSAINEISGELFRAESMDPDKAREAWIYDQVHAAMGEWMQFAADYDNLWKAGRERDPANLDSMRKRLVALRSKTDLPALVHELAMFAEDEGKRQRWINIGIMIGAALLAAASGGIASGAIGGIAGSIVGAGIESLTFTAITSTLNQDPSFGGFMAELALNFATFGGLRAISGGAKFLAGSKALTLPQKLGEMTVEGLWMVASAKAQEKIAEAFAHGGKVTPQSAASIFGQQMAISFASRVLVRVGGVFVEGVAGIEKLHEVQLALAKRAEEEHLARQVLDSGEGKLGEQLVKVDTDVLKVEQHALERVHEVASNPAEAAKHGITAEAGALERVAADAKGAAREVREREITALMAHAEVKADHAIVEPRVYAELVAKHRTQGSTIVEGFDSAGQPHAKITPSLADGAFGKPFTLHQRLGEANASTSAPHGIGEQQAPVSSAAMPATEWIERLKAQMTHTEREKFGKMQGKRSDADMQQQFSGDFDKALATVKKAAGHQADSARVLEASRQRTEQIREWMTAHGVMHSQEIEPLLLRLRGHPSPEQIAEVLSKVRSKAIGQLRAHELAGKYPGSTVLRDVQVLQEEAMTLEQFAKLPREKKQGLEVVTCADGKERVYRVVTDIDAVVVDRPLTSGKKARIVRLDQEKTGKRDLASEADAQNQHAVNAMLDHLNGRKNVILREGTTDITDSIDLGSVSTADKISVGPANKSGYKESLGVTNSDLDRLVKDLITDAIGKVGR